MCHESRGSVEWCDRRLQWRDAGALARRVHCRLSLRERTSFRGAKGDNDIDTCEARNLIRVKKSDKKRHETGPSAIANGSLATAVVLIVFPSRLNVSGAKV